VSVDPSEPESFADDDEEETVTADVEVPEADAAEQHTDLRPERDDPLEGIDVAAADPADAADQARVAGFDEDERP
jgi:hypothetical protein